MLLESLEKKGSDLRSASHSSRGGKRYITPYGEIGPRDEILLDSHIRCYNGRGDDYKAEREKGSEGDFSRLIVNFQQREAY